MKRIPRYLLYLISGFSVFIFLYTYVKPELTYHLQQLGFSVSKTFFRELANHPGGIAEYISLFLFQFSHSSYTGSIANAIIFYVILMLSDRLFHRRKSAIDTFLIFTPAIIAVMLMIDYTLHPVFPILVLLLLAFTKVGMKLLSMPINNVLKIGMLIIFLASFYYISGGFAFLVLCLSLVIWTLFSIKAKESYFEIIIILMVAFLIPKLASPVFFITEKDAFLRQIPYFSNNKPSIFLYASLLVLPAILVLQLPIRFSIKNLEIKKGFLKSEGLQLIQTFLMIGVLLYSLFYNFKEKIIIQHKIEIDKLAHERKWEDLLSYTKEFPINDRVTQFQINRALFFTGKLTDSLFSYPQYFGLDGLFLTRHFSNDMLLPSTELFFDLAYINEAIHYGNEAIAQNENSPLLIEQLILANIVADKYKAAQLYINALKDYPIYTQKALLYEKYINGDGYPEIDEMIIKKRELMPFTDFRVNRQNPSADLLNLLIDRPQNKMAYEYLMASFLLDNDLASFVKYYSIGRKFNYGKVPEIFQQALVLYSYELNRIGKSLGNLRYDKEVLEQFNEYLSILAKNKGDKELSMPELHEKFNNTYWFYIHYNSPVTKTKNE